AAQQQELARTSTAAPSARVIADDRMPPSRSARDFHRLRGGRFSLWQRDQKATAIAAAHSQVIGVSICVLKPGCWRSRSYQARRLSREGRSIGKVNQRQIWVPRTISARLSSAPAR